jgi:threonine 3-dehydrogenase
MNRVEDLVGENVAVLGCGTRGPMAIAVLTSSTLARFSRLVAVQTKFALSLQIKWVLTMVLNAQEDGENLLQHIKDAIKGNDVGVALEMSGNPEAVRQAFEMNTQGGRVSLLGTLEETLKLDIDKALIFKAAIVNGIAGR